jgi:hypothetical protein
MADELKFKYGTEAQILALTPSNPKWVNRAFYYPNDRSYFFQALDGVMKKYGGGTTTEVGIGIFLNDLVIGGVKRVIETNDVLDIPEFWDYDVFTLHVEGIINCMGQINMLQL